MKGLVKYFILRPTLVNLVMLLLIGVGLLQLINTQNTNFPKQQVRFVDVNLAFPGASPEEVEEGVTIKIEDKLQGIDGIKRVTSQSKDNISSIQVELEESTDANVLLVEVKNAIDRINNFPIGIESPTIEKREPADLTVSFAIRSNSLSLSEKKDIAQSIEDSFLAQKGISQVSIEGIPSEEIEVSVRETDLQRYGLTMVSISEAIRRSNLLTFGGTIESASKIINIKADNKQYFAKDLQNIKVSSTASGQTVYLKDVATVTDQFKDDATGRFFNQKPVVVVTVNTLNNEDILENAAFVKDYIEKFNSSHEGIQLQILEDGTVNLKERISTMLSSGIVGIFLVLIVLSLFLDRYLAFWVAVGIPISLIGMFILVPIQDMTINVVSLFGFILVLGILVDDAVVVGENIYRHAKDLGKPPLQAAVDGTMEMISPVIISLMTTATAFSLFLFLPEQVGEFFGEVSFVVIAVLFIAIIETFIILPGHIAHAKGLKKNVKLSFIEKWFGKIMETLRGKLFIPLFSKSVLKSRFSRVGTIIFFIIALLGCFSLVGSGALSFTFFPNIDDNAIFVELEMPPGTPIEITKDRLYSIEESVWEVNEQYSKKRQDDLQVVQFVEVITGPLENQGKVKVNFLEGQARGISSFELSRQIAQKSPEIPEARRLIFGLGATTSLFGLPVSFALKSNNLKELRGARDELVIGMRQNESVRDVSDTDLSGISEYKVNLRPNSEPLGLSLGNVMQQIRSGFFGIEAQSVQRGDDEIEIWVRLPKSDRKSLSNLLNTRINIPNGGTVPLKEIADIEESLGTLSIDRIDGIREIKVEANIANAQVSAPAAISAIETEVMPAILEKYPSVSYSVEGQARQSISLLDTMVFVGPIIFFLIFALIVFNCNSFSQAVMIFMLFPFTLIGVILGHFIHGLPLNIFSLIGTIALIGVFVNNTLVYISTFNELLTSGISFLQALKEAAYSRFRPILLTSITTIAGLAPLILSSSLSAQFLKGPAIAIAYGLLFGTFNVLFLLPVFLIALNKLRYTIHKLFSKESTTKAIELEPAIKLYQSKQMQ